MPWQKPSSRSISMTKKRQPLAELLLDRHERALELRRLGDVVARRVDVHAVDALEHRAAERIDARDGVDHVAEELDPERDRFLVGREHLDHVAAYAEGAAMEVVVVALVLDGDQAPDDLVAIHLLALAQLEMEPLVGVGLADAV